MSLSATCNAAGRFWAFRQRFRIQFPLLFSVACLFAVLAIVPLFFLLAQLLGPQEASWKHLYDNVLWGLVKNTILLLCCLIPLTAVIGVGLGWLTGACEFPGRRFFAWALVLPFAIPPYVFAFVYLGLFDFTGPVQDALRSVFPAMGFVDVRNVFGVSFILSLAFYPYVYLMSRGAFMTQGRSAMEAARTLGHRPARAFFRVALPLARPFIAAGIVLACMEALADFGAVSIFNYDTFTTAIYKAWFGFFSVQTAAQLSSVLVLFVLTALLVEQRMRARMRYAETGKASRAERLPLRGWCKWLATGFCSLVFFLAFVLPCIQLIVWAFEVTGEQALRYIGFGANTLILGFWGAFITIAVALVLAFAKRYEPGPVMNFASRFSTLGYALPGTVLAVGVFIPAAWLDARIAHAFSLLTGASLAPFIQGSVALVVAGYGIRFLSVGFGAVSSAMERISPSVGEAARTMGVTGFSLLRRVYLPMLRKGVLIGALLVLVDIMKELPITLMMRPFGWDTLAVKIYEYTSEAEWQLAAIPALALILAGLLPVLLLTKYTEK